MAGAGAALGILVAPFVYETAIGRMGDFIYAAEYQQVEVVNKEFAGPAWMRLVDPAPQPPRHHLHHLGQGPHRGVGDALGLALRDRLQAHGQGHGLLVVDQQRRQRRPRRQLVTTVDPALGLHRVTQLPQPVHVPPQRAGRDAQPAGQLAAGPVTLRLEQGQQPQRACAGIGHVSIMPRIQARK